MISSIDNLAVASLMVFLDKKVCDKGRGFTNYSGSFFAATNLYNNLYTYNLPFKQIVADSSVSGASILSGVYLNSNFIKIGQSGLVGINHQNGQAFFSNNVSAYPITGNYAVKDFNVYLTNKPEEELLFETQTRVRPKTAQTVTGLLSNVETYPALFFKSNSTINDPFALGGTVDTKIEVRVIALADNLFNLDAVCGLLRDTAHERLALLNATDLNLNYIGCLPSGYYNYDTIKNSKDLSIDSFYIEEVNVSKNFNFLNKGNNSIFPAFIDFTLSKIRNPKI
jgi:hypothetical protein